MYLRNVRCDDLVQDYFGIISVLTMCKQSGAIHFATLIIVIRETGEVLEGQEQDGVQLKQSTFYLLNELINCCILIS